MRIYEVRSLVAPALFLIFISVIDHNLDLNVDDTATGLNLKTFLFAVFFFRLREVVTA
jgi:hypothetical protein